MTSQGLNPPDVCSWVKATYLPSGKKKKKPVPALVNSQCSARKHTSVHRSECFMEPHLMKHKTVAISKCFKKEKFCKFEVPQKKRNLRSNLDANNCFIYSEQLNIVPKVWLIFPASSVKHRFKNPCWDSRRAACSILHSERQLISHTSKSFFKE